MEVLCEELSGVWGWNKDIPYQDIIKYLESFENNKSKNLKLAYIASNFYQYSKAYGLSPERKQVVKELYKNKHPINNQQDLDMSIKHVVVFINDGYLVEEAIRASEYGKRYKLQYHNDTHSGLGRPLTKKELGQPDFINEDGYEFEAKSCWETTASKYPSTATLDYTIDECNFNEAEFLAAFNKLDQVNALHTAPLCFCFVRKRATFGYLVGVQCSYGQGISAKLLGPLKVKFLRANPKFI